MVVTERITVETRGNSQFIDITDKVEKALKKSSMEKGIVTVFNVGSTAAITTTEYEPGLVNHDLDTAFEKIAPEKGRYDHELTWNDNNGHSHVRASMLGPSLTVPFVDREVTLGTWQQIILSEFDTRARSRTVICQIIGE